MNRSFRVAFVMFVLVVVGPGRARAHCDGMDGPVVTAARRAIETGDVNRVLIWVQKADEPTIKKAFERTVAVRKLNPEAQEMADVYFFETVVRIHRAAEGAPYTGLMPAGRDLGPAIPAADKALEDGSVERLVKLLTEAVEQGVREHFAAANGKKAFDEDDVGAGRSYVQAYVPFVHYVERIYEATKATARGHFPAAPGPAHAH